MKEISEEMFCDTIISCKRLSENDTSCETQSDSVSFPLLPKDSRLRIYLEESTILKKDFS